jgi:hypothetical protein
MNKTITYLHNCNCGDLIAGLAGMKEIYRKFGKKAIIYQQIDIPGHYMPGLVHSVKDDKGTQVTMNQKMFDMLRPLLLSQEYVEDFLVYTDQKIEIDLTIIREWLDYDPESPEIPPKVRPGKQFVNIPNLAIAGWTMAIYPPMACDISVPWITLPKEDVQNPISDYILVNRTERYRVWDMDYRFLKPYEKKLLFIGTEQEHNSFCREFKLNFGRLEVDNFLELAQAFQVCRFFLGNQSFPWNLANAMGVPRILEMYALAPNCQPFVGKDNFGAYQSLPLQCFFEDLYKRKAAPKEQLSL